MDNYYRFYEMIEKGLLEDKDLNIKDVQIGGLNVDYEVRV